MAGLLSKNVKLYQNYCNENYSGADQFQNVGLLLSDTKSSKLHNYKSKFFFKKKVNLKY